MYFLKQGIEVREMELQTTCAICGSSSKYKCQACENSYYCSKEHQRKDWKRHVEICKAFKLAENSILGRHYIATRNIKIGEIIFKDDEPLLAGPMYNSVPVCLGCYTVLHKSTAVPCIKCGWPLCQSCTVHGLECNFTCSRRDSKVSITEFDHPHPSYQCINVIRALSLKYVSPGSYKKLLSLESHCDQINNKKSFNFGNPVAIANFITRFFKVDDISIEEITKIIGILHINAHEVTLTKPPYVAVYEMASIPEHNCRANCSKSFTVNGGLIIHAATPISKGEHISICYTDPLWGTANRRHHLSETKFFECSCDRCKDTSEFGTMFNAVKCHQQNCLGYMLPTSFLNEEQKGYHCKVCGSIVSYEKIEDALQEIGIYLSRMKKNDITACKEFLQRYKDILHANHFYNTDINIALFSLIRQQNGNLKMVEDNVLIEIIELCKKLKHLLKLLIPAENRIRGMVLFELHVALTEFFERHATTSTSPLLLLQENKECLLDACQLLKYEPEVLPEGKLYINAKKNLEDLNGFLNRFRI